MKNIIIPNVILENINGREALKDIKNWHDDSLSPYNTIITEDVFYSNVLKINSNYFNTLRNDLFSEKNNYIINVSSNTNRVIKNLVVVPGTFQYLKINGNLSLNITKIENFIWVNDWTAFSDEDVVKNNKNILCQAWDNLTINTNDNIKLVLFNTVTETNKGLYCDKLIINAKSGVFNIFSQQNIKEIVFNLSGKKNDFIENYQRLRQEKQHIYSTIHYQMDRKFTISISNCKNLKRIDFSKIPFFNLNTLSLSALEDDCILVFNKNIEFEYSIGDENQLSSAFTSFTKNIMQTWKNSLRSFKPFINEDKEIIEVKFDVFLKLFRKEVAKSIDKRIKTFS